MRRRFQRKPPHLDYAREYKASGSHAKTRSTIAAFTESHQRQQVVKEETFDRDRAADKFVTTFAETRFATCGTPTLNTKSVLIERQRRKADKAAVIVPVDPANHIEALPSKPPVGQDHRYNTVKERKAAEAAAARTIKIEEAIRRAYGSQVLDLKALELIHIPPQVFGTMLRQLARLIRTVNVSRNALREIPREFCLAFPEAETLLYKENALDKLPEEITMLMYLQHLNAECNQLMVLPLHLPKSVEVLNVSRNRLQRVPNLQELTRLVEMDLSFNLLQLLPNGLMALAKLKVLSLAGNRLVTLATLPRMTCSAEGGSSFGRGDDRNQGDTIGDGDGTDQEQEKKQWRVEEDPETKDTIYFHLATKQVTRVKPACFRVTIPALRLPTNPADTRTIPSPMHKESAAEILKRFPEGWEIILGDATSTQIQYQNHCTGESFTALPPALDRLGDLTYLHSLDVSGNQLQELPPSIVRAHVLIC
jgi:Leucine-rich repeat (LRR) protein